MRSCARSGRTDRQTVSQSVSQSVDDVHMHELNMYISYARDTYIYNCTTSTVLHTYIHIHTYIYIYVCLFLYRD